MRLDDDVEATGPDETTRRAEKRGVSKLWARLRKSRGVGEVDVGKDLLGFWKGQTH